MRLTNKEILTLDYDDHGGLFADCPLVDVYVGRNLEYTSGSSYYLHESLAANHSY